jgi:isopenicillin N synthase-like dioxygenase
VQLPEGRSRYAMPFFFEPRYDAMVEPLPECCDADDPPHYEPFAFGAYLTQRFSKAYD